MDKINETRLLLGISFTELADLFGVSYTDMSDIIDGRRQPSEKILKSVLEMSCYLFYDGMISLEYKQREKPLGGIHSSW